MKTLKSANLRRCTVRDISNFQIIVIHFDHLGSLDAKSMGGLVERGRFKFKLG